jgi:hypothetical protein
MGGPDRSGLVLYDFLAVRHATSVTLTLLGHRQCPAANSKTIGSPTASKRP